MDNKTTIKKYVAYFLGQFGNILKPGVSVNIKALPVKGEGGIIEFDLSDDNLANTKLVFDKSYETLVEAVRKSRQTMVGSVGDKAVFGGTNISVSGNVIVFIKGDDSSGLWHKAAAVKDAERVYEMFQGSINHGTK